MCVWTATNSWRGALSCSIYINTLPLTYCFVRCARIALFCMDIAVSTAVSCVKRLTPSYWDFSSRRLRINWEVEYAKITKPSTNNNPFPWKIQNRSWRTIWRQYLYYDNLQVYRQILNCGFLKSPVGVIRGLSAIWKTREVWITRSGSSARRDHPPTTFARPVLKTPNQSNTTIGFFNNLRSYCIWSNMSSRIENPAPKQPSQSRNE